MAQNYIRQSTFSDGDKISASLFNNEYEQLVNAFSYSSTSAVSTGHRHDGTLGQGGNIFKIGDLAFLNKIEVDSTNNRWGFYVEVSSAAVEQIRIQDGGIVPVTTNDIDLGTSSLEFKDLFLDGTAHIDTLDVDVNATVAGTLGVTGVTTLSSNLSVGGNLTVTGNATIAGNLTFGDAATDTVSFSADVASNLLPSTNNAFDLGASSSQWKDLYIDGTANIDSLVADTADINGGTIDGATIATSDITVGSGKTLDVSAGTLTLADNQISGDKVEGGTIAAITITSLTATSADINGGTIDGVTIGGTSAGAVTFTDLSDGTITIAGFADEDNMSSNSATLVPTQQSVKAYVDAQVTAQDLDLTTDSGTIAIDLDSETLTVSGGTGIDSSATGNAVTLAIDSTVATLTGSQTLTNKTLTSPDINTPDIDGGTIDSTVIGGSTPAAGTFTTITGTLATAAQTNITSVGTLSSLTTSGNVTVGGNLTVNGTTTTLNTATLDVEDKNITLNKGSGDTSGSANGAGLTIQDAVDASTDATILWDATNNKFDFSHPISVTGAFTGTGTSVFANLDISGDVDIDGTLETDALTIGGVTSVPFEAADHSKLDGIEANATADQTASEIRTLVESASDSNVFTDADHSKLDGIEASADVTDTTNVTAAGALMRTGGAMTGAITTNSTFDGRDVATDGAKLDGIETNADVTDTANVTAAGALMDSELTSIASVKALNQGVATTDSPTFAGITSSGTTNTVNLTINGTQGSDGQVLTSTGSGVQWETATGGINGITSNSTSGTALTIDSSNNVEIANHLEMETGGGMRWFTDTSSIVVNASRHMIFETSKYVYPNYVGQQTMNLSANGLRISTLNLTTLSPTDAGNPLYIQTSDNLTYSATANGAGNYQYYKGVIHFENASGSTGAQSGIALRIKDGIWKLAAIKLASANQDADFIIQHTGSSGTSNGFEALRIKTGGNVGIATDNPSEKLDVSGTINATNYKVGGAQGTDGQVLTSTGSGVQWEDAAGGVGGIVSESTQTTSNVVKIHSSGRVGINFAATSGPVAILDVFSDESNRELLRLRNGGHNDAQIRFFNAGHSSTYVGIDAAESSNMVIDIQANKDFILSTNDTERFRVLSSGNMGIGTSSPTELLHVNGTLKIENLKVGHESTAQGTDGQVLTSTGSGIAWEDAPSPNGISVNGSVTSSDTLMEIYTSVVRFKKHIDFDIVGTRNTVIAQQNGALGLTSSSGYNVFIGHFSGDSVTSANAVMAIGPNARSYGNASNDMAIGRSALFNSDATNGYNTAIGHFAGTNNYNGTKNTYVGYSAGYGCQTGFSNTAVGFEAGKNLDRDGYNTAIGEGAMKLQDHNTAPSGADYHSGFNVAVGTSAGSLMTRGFRNVFIGNNTQLATQTDTDCIVIGPSVTSTGTGNFTFGSGSSDSNIANGATTITAPSDERYKEDITDSTAGLSFIKDLRPVTFRWKKEKDIPTTQVAYVEGSETRVMNDKTNHGFIAQEVKAVIDSHPEIKDGFDMWMEDAADGRQRLGPSALIPILVKAIQELEARVNELENK